MTTNIQKAREWAERMGKLEGLMPGPRAAVEVIQSLPDQWVDAEKVREVISKILANTIPGTVGCQVAEDYAALIGELLPTPPLPTLAELIEAGNDPRQYQWMRAKDSNGEDLYLTRIMEVTSEVVYRDGMTVIDINSEFTPLPDLPRLEWPSLFISVETEDVTEESGPAQEPQPVVKTLRTVEDYQNAAEGTIVREGSADSHFAYEKSEGYWHGCDGFTSTSPAMAGTARTVLWEPKP